MTHTPEQIKAAKKLWHEWDVCQNSDDDIKTIASFLADRDSAKDEVIAELREECADLRREVREWFCVDCRTVYPGPPQELTKCVICPKCGGRTVHYGGDSPMWKLRAEKAEALNADLAAKLGKSENASNDERVRLHAKINATDQWLSDNNFKTLDEVEAKLSALDLKPDDPSVAEAVNLLDQEHDWRIVKVLSAFRAESARRVATEARARELEGN